jgi:DNA-binding phage protein
LFNKRKFMAAAVLCGKNMSDVAEMLGISRVTLYRKLNGDSDFMRNEIEKCCIYLAIENPCDVFFCNKVS